MERFLTIRSQKDLLEYVNEVRVFESTDRGVLSLVPHFPPELFAHLELDDGLGSFAHYSSIIKKLEVFEKVAAEEDGRVTLALIDGRIIVGYGACWYPRMDDRWSKLGKLIYEMGALEVSRNFRNLRVGKRIFQLIMEDDFFEDKIAYMNGYSWHWDVDGSGLTLAQYRRMMIHLLKDHGFQEFFTNEPNIALRQENFFMARIGSRVSDKDRKRFRDLRFGIVRRE
jgi:acetoin utilization protein AcuA